MLRTTMEVLLILLAISCGILNVSSAGADAGLRSIYSSEIQRLDQLMAAKCPEYTNTKLVKRDAVQMSFADQGKHYNALIRQLDQCVKSRKSVAQPAKTQVTKTLSECTDAKNVTDWWRKSWVSGWSCDFDKNIGWFRFSGKAGSRMRDTCPLDNSCGTGTPYWTDEAMPTEVGVVSKVKVYGVRGNSCKTYSKYMEVMRCPGGTSHNLIYRYTDKPLKSCTSGFCGMD